MDISDGFEASHPRFGFLFQGGLQRALALVDEGRIEGADLKVLLHLMAHTTPANRVEATITWLAKERGCNRVNYSRSFSRLARAGLTARWREPKSGNTYLLVDPTVFSYGRPAVRAAAKVRFRAVAAASPALAGSPTLESDSETPNDANHGATRGGADRASAA